MKLAMTVVACLLVLPLAAIGAEPQVQEPEAEQVEVLARELLEVTGAGELGKQMMQQTVSSFQQSQDEIPQEFWDQLMEEVDPQELEEMVIPIYAKHFTAEEMTAAIEFYRSPAGQSILNKMPLVVGESMAVGQKWGESLARTILERIERYQESQPST